jgi:hypothetical protein
MMNFKRLALNDSIPYDACRQFPVCPLSLATIRGGMKTQGEVEAAICDGITRFEQEYMGRGPKGSHCSVIAQSMAMGSPPKGWAGPDRSVLNAGRHRRAKRFP